MRLRDFFTMLTGRRLSVETATALPTGPQTRHASIILCNDATELHRSGEQIEDALRGQGHDIRIKCVSNERQLLAALEDIRKKGDAPPNAIFMDVGGVGEKTARKVIKWYDRHYPRQPLPAMNFLSLSIDMGITEAGRLRGSDARVQAGFVDESELIWLVRYLGGQRKNNYKPVSTAFRDVLNETLGTKLPLDHDAGYYKDMIRDMMKVTNDRVLAAWQKGKLAPEQAIDAMRNYALGLSASFLGGFYVQGKGQDGAALGADARFYASAGFPFKGPAVYSLDEVQMAWSKYSEKPVLVMQSYDPAVVPLLASGQLGGLVVTSPYMASHLKMLCETHMVSGLFGMIPGGDKTLAREFNEEAKPDLPPYFAPGEAAIGGTPLKPGQMLLVGLNGDGLSLNPPDFVKTAPPDLSTLAEDEKAQTDIKNLQLLNRCFAELFASRGATPHGVKSNVDACGSELLRLVQGIGLVRTEQMVAANSWLVEGLKNIVLGKNEEYQEFSDNLRYRYRELIEKLDTATPVKFRLFDFVHGEILNKDEQKEFVGLYGRLDIHGGAALETWPRLYREQVRTIFEALKEAHPCTDQPLEIMMPAVRTEADVLAIRAVVDDEAQKAGIEPARYSFGVMAETLDACRNIAAIAKHVDFISFGTNDLTQEALNIPRNDLKTQSNFEGRRGFNPFKKLAPEILDIIGETIQKGRESNPSLKIDICGAQAADPDMAMKLYDMGIDNISVAPSLGNLFGLPVLLNYRAYDALKGPAPAGTPPTPA